MIVNRESYITFETNRYSVPPQYIGKMLYLKIDPMEKTGELITEGQPIRKIELLESGGRGRITLPEDREAVRKLWLKQTGGKKTKNDVPASDKEMDVDTRSPASYDKLIDTDGEVA